MSSPYVINLDKSGERWTKIQNDWRGVFHLHRISAVEQSPGWVGCGFSHLKAIEGAKKRGDPYVLVWEDDCVPRKRNGEYTKPSLIKKLWEQAMVKLSAHPERWDIVLGATSRVFDTPVPDPVLSGNTVKVYRLTKGFTTHWTLYNASVYDTMLKWKDNISSYNPIDTYMYSNARVFVTVPFMAEQAVGESTIENRETNYEAWFNTAETQFKRPPQKSIIDTLPQAKIKVW
jgi:hypothetical protein